MDDSLDEAEATGPGTDANVDTEVEETAGLANQLKSRPDTHLPVDENSARACQSSVGLSHQVDGADDIALPEDAFSRPGISLEAWSEMSSINGSSICNGSAGPPMSLDDLTSSEDDDDQDMDSLHNIELGNDPDMQNASRGDESRSSSWGSFPSDSEDDDDESAMDESPSEGFAHFEDDSDEMADETVVDGKVQPGMSLEAEQQIEHNLQAPSREVDITRAPILPSPVPQLPPISSVISTGPNDWMSCSQTNWGPRSPSPSDAVLLPRHCRTNAGNSDKTQVDAPLDTSDQVVPEVQEDDVGDSRSQFENPVRDPERVNPDINTTNFGTTDGDDGHAEFDHHALLGKKSGKVEFFAARAVNKRVHDANMQVERLSEASPQPKLGPPHVFSKDDCDAEENVPFANTPELADSHFTSVLAPYARELIREVKGRDTNQQPEPADPQRRSLLGDDYPYGLEAAAWSSFDPDFQEPSSAYELQNLKSRLRAMTPLGSTSKASRDMQMQNAYETMVNTVQAPAKVETPKAISYTFEQLKHKRQLLGGLEPSALANGLENTNKGKRKAAEISEESPAEYRWAFSSKDKSEAMNSAEELPSSSYTAASSTKNQTPLPSPPPSPEESPTLEQRPTKKIKRIAERVGYAALGGVSVGAMVLTSLIYTAPNFV